MEAGEAETDQEGTLEPIASWANSLVAPLREQQLRLAPWKKERQQQKRKQEQRSTQAREESKTQEGQQVREGKTRTMVEHSTEEYTIEW